MDPHPASALNLPAGQPIVDGLAARAPLRTAITQATRRPEPEALAPLLQQARMPDDIATRANVLARRIATQLRNRTGGTGKAGLVQGLMQEYALSSQEGVALMCLAEALLRIPDMATRDALIRDKIAKGQWSSHAGRSTSLFVNAATWGLLLTGKLVATHSEVTLSTVLSRLIGKGGEPLIRKGVDMAMRMMGEQFVTGETIAQALGNARTLEAEGFRYSYDMLGEAALTLQDAERYRRAYEDAIHAIGKASNGRGVYEGPGISIKLSALHPRYSRAQVARVMAELYPILRQLALLARSYDIGLNIDAEEADRLELSLDLLEQLCMEPGLAGWNGIGFVIQGYQKRCPYVIEFIVDLARRSGHRLMVRLVKGAYWDSEIKRAQIDGLSGYPVYTRKAYTDVSYLACAKKLLAAPDAVYPQFATHNAHTLSAIHELADPATYKPGQYEFQCLHGMGEPLYEQVVGANKLDRPCRIYAPVGTHETLLAYLVRRLLENGANTSFVNRIADSTIPIEMLVEDPVATVDRMAAEDGAVGMPHHVIALPRALYGRARINSRGLDLADEISLLALQKAVLDGAGRAWVAGPMLTTDVASELDAAGMLAADGSAVAPTQPEALGAPVLNPSDHDDVVGSVREATTDQALQAVGDAHAFAARWAATSAVDRAGMLERAADALEAGTLPLLGLMAREAGKTYANGVSEVREAADFLRYYAAQARTDFSADTHKPLGPVVCISPWNFPLAIFTGQIAAALAAGNPVLAKPAEQTPLVAAEAVRLLWASGVPRAALQLLPGRGETVGAALVADPRVQGVMFTGSTDVARILQKTLAVRLNADGKPVPLIAETGGQNAMIVDSSALAEQVVADVISSAFDSAGQRCSALRLLCVQDDVADRIMHMLKGAMSECRIGNPLRLAMDVGPVIDAEARDNIERHVTAMREAGRQVHRLGLLDVAGTRRGTFVVPTVIEIDSIDELKREVFGPVLHMVRYRRRDLPALLAQINGTGYGLTLGVHTRIDETVAQVVELANAGNVYVNRNIVGAVVGVQPFGGEGLSGTGPKAGGPLYMLRMLSARPDDVLSRALVDADPGNKAATGAQPAPPHAIEALASWAGASGRPMLATICKRFASLSRSGWSRTLAGPTGERNVYTLVPREAVLCIAGNDDDRLTQLAAVLAAGSRPIWPAGAQAEALMAKLPDEVVRSIALAQDWSAETVVFDAVLHHGSTEDLQQVLRAVAARPGPIVGVRSLKPGETDVALESLVIERALSVNTAAAGGNASLMTTG